ncbi:MAG: hypothetical protein ACRCTC_01980, partial [Cetobacterium sp.]
KILFEMLGEKEEQIKRIEIEKKLIENELKRKANKLLVYSRVYEKLTIEEFTKAIEEDWFKVSNVRKQDNLEAVTYFDFTVEQRKFSVRLTKNVKYVSEIKSAEEMDMFCVLVEDGCVLRSIGKDFRLRGVSSIIKEWLDERR